MMMKDRIEKFINGELSDKETTTFLQECFTDLELKEAFLQDYHTNPKLKEAVLRACSDNPALKKDLEERVLADLAGNIYNETEDFLNYLGESEDEDTDEQKPSEEEFQNFMMQLRKEMPIESSKESEGGQRSLQNSLVETDEEPRVSTKVIDMGERRNGQVWMKVAAAVSIVVVASLGIFYYFSTTPNNTLENLALESGIQKPVESTTMGDGPVLDAWEQAKQLYDDGNYAQAVNEFEALLADDSFLSNSVVQQKNYVEYAQLFSGYSYLQLDKPELAIPLLEQLENKPYFTSNYDIFKMLAVAYKMQGDLDKAESYFDKSLE